MQVKRRFAFNVLLFALPPMDRNDPPVDQEQYQAIKQRTEFSVSTHWDCRAGAFHDPLIGFCVDRELWVCSAKDKTRAFSSGGCRNRSLHLLGP